jgi:hypothetical protein
MLSKLHGLWRCLMSAAERHPVSGKEPPPPASYMAVVFPSFDRSPPTPRWALSVRATRSDTQANEQGASKLHTHTEGGCILAPPDMQESALQATLIASWTAGCCTIDASWERKAAAANSWPNWRPYACCCRSSSGKPCEDSNFKSCAANGSCRGYSTTSTADSSYKQQEDLRIPHLTSPSQIDSSIHHWHCSRDGLMLRVLALFRLGNTVRSLLSSG